MTIIGRRSIGVDEFNTLNDNIEIMEASTLDVLSKLMPSPGFKAIYTFPVEFRALAPRQKGHGKPQDDRAIYTPFVLFIAKPAIKSIVK